MSLIGCYDALGGNYEEVLARLHSQRLVDKFVRKFLSDPSYDLLERSMAAEDWPEAFRAAHTIKGVSQNLSFTTLYQSGSALAEALRHGWTPEAPALYDQVRADYARTVAAIRAYEAESEVRGAE